MSELLNELLTKVFVEQPLALPGSAKFVGTKLTKIFWIWDDSPPPSLENVERETVFFSGWLPLE